MKTRVRKKKNYKRDTSPHFSQNKSHPQVTTEEGDRVWKTSFLASTGLCASSRVLHEASVFLQLLGQFVSLCSHLTRKHWQKVNLESPVALENLEGSKTKISISIEYASVLNSIGELHFLCFFFLVSPIENVKFSSRFEHSVVDEGR